MLVGDAQRNREVQADSSRTSQRVGAQMVRVDVDAKKCEDGGKEAVAVGVVQREARTNGKKARRRWKPGVRQA